MQPPHQACYSVTADLPPAVTQVLSNARAAVPSPSFFENASNLDRQPSIVDGPRTLRAATPSVVATPRHLEDFAKHRHRVVRLLRVDSRVPHWLSLAKKAIAFFRI